MESLGIVSDKINILEELKNNTLMPNYLKIKTYKDYLVNEKKYYYPDALMEWVAREQLGLQRTEEELFKIREEAYYNMKRIEEEDRIGEEECKKIDEENKIKIL
tara:strand:- start:621 stop:932 length:312 start_codon:yes stop_codon:yes gene_type:complete